MVGIEGAGLSGLGAGGVLGAGARAQYAAMAQLRWNMFSHSLHSSKGALELGARTVANLLYAAMGVAIGLGAGAGSYLIASNNAWQYVPIVFWAMCFLWQMVPIMLASFQEQFDLGILLRFPVLFGSYFLLYVVSGLVDISTILGGLCSVGILVGVTMARPDLFGWTLLGLAVFAAFNILLVRAIFAWIDRWLAQRRTREILGAIFMVMILSLQLLNPALHQRRHAGRNGQPAQRESVKQQTEELKARYGPWLQAANQVQSWLPPGLAARALRQAAAGEQSGYGAVPALGSLSVLGMYTLAAGGALAARLKSEYRGENLGQAPSRKKVDKRDRGWLPNAAGPVAAVIEKELRSLLRTMPVLYALGMPVVMVFFFSAMFHNGTSRSLRPQMQIALPIGVAYALLGFTQLFYNNLGAEGAGIQLYFLSPTPIRSVMLAKNLFHSALFLFDALVAGFVVSFRIGVPNNQVIAATAAWLLFALPSNLAVGNIFSVTMPYRVNPGRMARQRGSQANALLSLLVQLGILGIGVAVFALCTFAQALWLAIPIFLALAAGAIVAWLRVLTNIDGMANQRRDSLMATLMKMG
jgi:ABC-2 type transport system permease protein